MTHATESSQELARTFRKNRVNAVFFSEVAKKSVSARLQARSWRRAGMAPTSGAGRIRNTAKQSTWRIWTGPLRTRDGTWTGPGWNQAREGLDGTPRDSSRPLGLSDPSKKWYVHHPFVWHTLAICIAMLLQMYQGQGTLGTPKPIQYSEELEKQGVGTKAWEAPVLNTLWIWGGAFGL